MPNPGFALGCEQGSEGYFRLWTATVRREIEREAVPRLITPFDAARSTALMAAGSASLAALAFLAPMAARTRLTAVRIAVFCAVLRAWRLARCRFCFSADLMFATTKIS